MLHPNASAPGRRRGCRDLLFLLTNKNRHFFATPETHEVTNSPNPYSANNSATGELTSEPDSREATILGHPKGLFVLFFAEMWERFSYYGMRALLVFYLTKHWLFSDQQAGAIYGTYTALVYITPVLGGYLADRYLGQRKAVLFGAVLLTFGHFIMGFEGARGDDANQAPEAPRGRHETTFLSSLRDLLGVWVPFPWARAHGYIISPLRGCDGSPPCGG